MTRQFRWKEFQSGGDKHSRVRCLPGLTFEHLIDFSFSWGNETFDGRHISLILVKTG
jgi:hypothetical protein